MEILGIGPFEILLVVVLALIVMGPDDMMKNARRMGKALRGFVRSDFWRELVGTSRDIRNIPKELIKETGLEEDIKDIQKTTRQLSAELSAEARQTTQELNAGVKQVTETAREEIAAAKSELKAETPAPLPQPSTPPPHQPPQDGNFDI